MKYRYLGTVAMGCGWVEGAENKECRLLPGEEFELPEAEPFVQRMLRSNMLEAIATPPKRKRTTSEGAE